MLNKFSVYWLRLLVWVTTRLISGLWDFLPYWNNASFPPALLAAFIASIDQSRENTTRHQIPSQRLKQQRQIPAGFQMLIPIMYQLCHQFEDRCSAGWVMVPEFNCPLQDWHVGWVAARWKLRNFVVLHKEKRSQPLPKRPSLCTAPKSCKGAYLIRLNGHAACWGLLYHRKITVTKKKKKS